jgi:hypothetical protein
MTMYPARITRIGFLGWWIEILSRADYGPALTMVEQPPCFAWTRRGATRRAQRMLRRRLAADRRTATSSMVVVGETGPEMVARSAP